MVDPDLMLDRLESSKAPEICGLDIVFGVGVKALVGRHELIELMDDQEDGIELRRVGHERGEGGVASILSEAQSVVGTVGRSVRIRAAPSVLTGSGDGSDRPSSRSRRRD